MSNRPEDFEPSTNRTSSRSVLSKFSLLVKPYLPYISLVIVLIVLGMFLINGVFANLLGLFQSGPNIASAATTQSILTGIQPMGQLVSISAQLAKANITVGVEQPGLLNSNFCGFSASFVAEGTIRAGIDLTQLDEADLTFDEETQTYTLMLPTAQVTSCSIDYIDQYAGSTTLCPGVDWDEARQIAGYMALTEFRDDAVESGLLSRAEQQAVTVLVNMLSFMTGKEIIVEFRPATDNAPQLDSTCSPQPPTGWTYDAAKRTWTETQ